MKRITILGLLAAMTVAVEAQPKSNVLAKGDGVWMPKPEVTVDKKTKKKVCVWGDTENNSWHENIGLVSNVPVAKDFESAFPTSRMFGTNTPYIPCPWQLAEENGETVLHCYLKMPADIVENLWLASNETAILDKETGTLYRSFQYNFRVTNAMNQTLGRGAGLSEGAVTVPDKLAFSFPLYGIYVERGVGRGYTRGNTGDLLKFKGGRGRTRRWWYYNVFVRQRHRLGQLVAQQYGRAAAAQILTIEVKSISRQ